MPVIRQKAIMLVPDRLKVYLKICAIDTRQSDTSERCEATRYWFIVGANKPVCDGICHRGKIF
jgi:hypothetical protein